MAVGFLTCIEDAGEGDVRSMVEGAGLDSVRVAAPFRRSATPSPAAQGG